MKKNANLQQLLNHRYAFSDYCNAEGHIRCYSENYKYLNDKSPYCISQILFALKCITLAVLN